MQPGRRRTVLGQAVPDKPTPKNRNNTTTAGSTMMTGESLAAIQMQEHQLGQKTAKTRNDLSDVTDPVACRGQRGSEPSDGINPRATTLKRRRGLRPAQRRQADTAETLVHPMSSPRTKPDPRSGHTKQDGWHKVRGSRSVYRRTPPRAQGNVKS